MKYIILIVAAFIIAVGAVVGGLVAGVNSYDVTVNTRPYEEGLAVEETRRIRAELGWQFAIANRIVPSGTQELVITLTDRDGAPLTDAAVTTRIFRVNKGDKTQEVDAVRAEDGTYRVAALLDLPGRWNTFTTVKRGEDATFYETFVTVQ